MAKPFSNDLRWKIAETVRNGLSRRKTAERSRDDIAEARRKWLEWQTDLRPERLVFLDETWTSTHMAPRYGRGAKGQRVEGLLAFDGSSKPWHRCCKKAMS